MSTRRKQLCQHHLICIRILYPKATFLSTSPLESHLGTANIFSRPDDAYLLIHLLSSTLSPLQFALHFNWIMSPAPLLKIFQCLSTTLRIKSGSVPRATRPCLIWPLQPHLLPPFLPLPAFQPHWSLVSSFCFRAFAHVILDISNAYPPHSSCDNIYSSLGSPLGLY